MGQQADEGENVEVIVKRIALLVLALAACVDAAQAQAQTSTQAETPVVVTVGQGVVKRAPDQAWVTIAAESRAKTPAEAQKLNADAMSGVMQKLKGVGLPAEAIQTSAYELRPEFDYANNRQTLRGYVARNAIEVRVDDLPKLGQVLDVSVGGGATSVSGIRFDLKDRRSIEQIALQRAVADAREQANTAAQASGLKVEKVVRIEVHREAAMPPPRPMYAMRAEMAASAEPPIAPGELEVKATVTMTSAVR
jgi:uncharacterized protein YggE